MTPTWLSKLLDEDRIGFVAEHGLISRGERVGPPRSSNGHPLRVGDFVCHVRFSENDDDERQVGYVVGFGASREWVRVRTLDNRRRLWRDRHIHNVDADTGEGNYAPCLLRELYT